MLFVYTPTPRIYVACLASYNSGLLHGEWIDANQSPDAILEAIQAMIQASPTPYAEEWAIHDYENFHGVQIHEYTSLETVSKIALAIEEHGEAVAAFINYHGLDYLDNFEEQHQGTYASEADFVEEMLEDTGALEPLEKAGLLYYIDFEKMARDWFINDYWSADCSDGVVVFSYY
jgi:antirestriction protein